MKLTELDHTIQDMSETARECKDALELAVLMLKEIQHGKRIDGIIYCGAIYQMKAILGIATLENAHTHVIHNTEEFSKDYQSFVEIIYNCQAQIQRENAL